MPWGRREQLQLIVGSECQVVYWWVHCDKFCSRPFHLPPGSPLHCSSRPSKAKQLSCASLSLSFASDQHLNLLSQASSRNPTNIQPSSRPHQPWDLKLSAFLASPILRIPKILHQLSKNAKVICHPLRFTVRMCQVYYGSSWYIM